MSNETCPICHGAQWLATPIEVPVNDPRFNELRPCTCYVAELEAKRIRSVLGDSLMPPDCRRMTFDSFNPREAASLAMPQPYENDYYGQRRRTRVRKLRELSVPLSSHLARAKKLCQEYADNPQQGHLILLGEPGSGKTHLAAAVGNYLLERGTTVVFAVVPDLLDSLRPGRDGVYHNLLMAYQTAPLLILDDLGTEKGSDWTGEKLYQIVNYRYNHLLPLIVTSNEMPQDIDPRLHSRLFDRSRALVFEILAGDYRMRNPEGR